MGDPEARDEVARRNAADSKRRGERTTPGCVGRGTLVNSVLHDAQEAGRLIPIDDASDQRLDVRHRRASEEVQDLVLRHWVLRHWLTWPQGQRRLM
jgi:hypothetical protein